VGPAGERARRVSPAPVDLGFGARTQYRHRPDARQQGGGDAEGRRSRGGCGALARGDHLGGPGGFADLDVENPEALVGLGMPVLGYYSHVDVSTKEAAEAAGVDLVVPRSRMARELPDLVERLLDV